MSGKKREIVKAQLSLFDSTGKGSVLLYNKDRSVLFETGETAMVKAMKEAMGGEPKKFFYADTTKVIMVIKEEAPWQDW